MPWPHFKHAAPRVLATIEARLEQDDFIAAVSYAFQNGFRFDESDVARPHFEQYEKLRASDGAAALAYWQRNAIAIESEKRALTKVRSLANAYGGPTPQRKHTEEVAKTRAADRERELAKQAEALIAQEDATARAARVAKARERIQKETPQ